MARLQHDTWILAFFFSWEWVRGGARFIHLAIIRVLIVLLTWCSNGGPQIAYSDAGVAVTEDYSSSIDRSTHQKDALYYSTKEYIIVPKPLLSAFHWKNLALTSLRSFLLFYLPLLENVLKIEDDDDFLQDPPKDEQVDLVKPFKKSVKQILREVRSLDLSTIFFLNITMCLLFIASICWFFSILF